MSRNKHNRLRRKKAKKPTTHTLSLDFESRGINGRSVVCFMDDNGKLHELKGDIHLDFLPRNNGSLFAEIPYQEAAENVRQSYERTQRDAAIRRTLDTQISTTLYAEPGLLTSNQADVIDPPFSMERLSELIERHPVPEHLNSTRDLIESFYRPRLFDYQRDIYDWLTQRPELSLPTYTELLRIKENSHLQQRDWYNLGDIKVRWLAADEAYTLFQTVKAGESYFTAGCRKNYSLHRALTHWTSNLNRNGLGQRARLFLGALAELQKEVL